MNSINKAVLSRAIILCWILLAICFIIKLLGGNWFEISTQNERFIKICTYVDNYDWLKIIIGIITESIALTLYWLAICGKRNLKLKTHLLLELLICVLLPIKFYFSIINFPISIILCVVVPIVFMNRGKGNYRIISPIIACVLYVLFFGLSIVTKNIGTLLHNGSIDSGVFIENTLIALIWSIDLYIMLLLQYLYCAKNGGYMFASWFFSKNVTQLMDYRKRFENKTDEKSIKKVAKIDTRIAELESKKI